MVLITFQKIDKSTHGRLELLTSIYGYSTISTRAYTLLRKNILRISQKLDALDSCSECMLIWNKYDNAKVMHASSFLARGDFYHLLITFANSLDSDQDQKNVRPDLDPNHLTI